MSIGKAITRRLWGIEYRPARVFLGIKLIIILSIFDYLSTAIYIESVGLFEGNGNARFVFEYYGMTGLAAMKILSVGLAVTILWLGRRKWQAELSCYLCCGVLVYLLVQWFVYNDHIVSKLTGPDAIAPNDRVHWIGPRDASDDATR